MGGGQVGGAYLLGCCVMWNPETEALALDMRAGGHTYDEIARTLGTSPVSVKHKVRRLQQASNQDRYKHTAEKTALALKCLAALGNTKPLSVLETHAGFGSMTQVYSQFGKVLALDIDHRRINGLESLALPGVEVVKADSEFEMHGLLASRAVFDVVDLDPYGMPSRYFPMVFGLINDGLLFVTFPMIGAAQINKITIRHLQAFWGVALDDKDRYTDLLFAGMQDYAFHFKRKLTLLAVERYDRVFRFAIRVKKESLLETVGIQVNRRPKVPAAIVGGAA